MQNADLSETAQELMQGVQSLRWGVCLTGVPLLSVRPGPLQLEHAVLGRV